MLRLQELLRVKGVDNTIILLRKKKINRCLGCVEYCNNNLKCQIKDDMPAIMRQMQQADAFIFISPNYFKMPPGLFKDFIDRCSVFYTRSYFKKPTGLENKKAVVIVVGTDTINNINVCLKNIAANFCRTLGLQVVAQRSFRSHSELNGNYNDIFSSGINPRINSELRQLVETLTNSV